MTKNLAHYMSLHYPTEVDREEEKDGIVVAFHPDLPGCVAQGTTANEALESLDEARAAWIATALEDRLAVPEPPDEKYSGKVLVRMMPALHAAMALRAKREKVSLNHLIVSALAQSAGFSTAIDYMGRVREEMQAVPARPRLVAPQPVPPEAERKVK